MGHFGAHDSLVPLPSVLGRRKQLDFFHLRTQMLDDLGKSFLGFFIGALPHRRFDKSEHRRQRRLFGGNRGEWNMRPLVGCRHRFRRTRRTVRRAARCRQAFGEQADMIEGARERRNPMARNQSMGRFETDDAAIRRRTNGRSVGLAADRERHHVRRHRRCRTAGGAPGRMLPVMRIAGFTGLE